jgi:flavin-dependent dehydrogenase
MIEKDIVVIGGGAAGFFAAINIAEQAPGLNFPRTPPRTTEFDWYGVGGFV